MASSSRSFKLTSESDHKTLITKAVDSLYKTGSDHRKEKRASETKPRLVENIRNKIGTDTPACVGMWSMISLAERQSIRKTKNCYVDLDQDIMINIVKIIMANANTYSDTHYCSVSRKALSAYEEFLRTKDKTSEKLLKSILNFRSIFEDQERQKVDD